VQELFAVLICLSITGSGLNCYELFIGLSLPVCETSVALFGVFQFLLHKFYNVKIELSIYKIFLFRFSAIGLAHLISVFLLCL